MMRKSLWTCVLLLGLLLGTSSIANADAISTTSLTLTSLQLVSSAGTIVLSPPLTRSPTSASGAAANSFDESSSELSQSPTRAEASASVNFAGAGGVSDLNALFMNANSNVMLSGCVCAGESEGLAGLAQSFTIVGGTGNVNVTFSALLETVQNLVTDEFSLFAASDARFSVQIVDVRTFSLVTNLHIGPNALTTLEMQRQISEVFNLQFGQQYTLTVFLGANSRAAQSEVPEPATAVLLVSGLGFLAGYVRKRRLIR